MRKIQQAYENGWEALVPIVRGEKRPAINDWPNHIATPESIAGAEKALTTTWGMKGQYAPGLDIDIDDKEIVKDIYRLAHDMLGQTPLRFGRFPRCLLPYRTEVPIPHKELTIIRNADATIWQVELIGDGQQYVLMGQHPTAGPYVWNEGMSPDVVPFDAIPFVTEAHINAFMRMVAELFPEPEYSIILRGAKTRTGDPVDPETLLAPDIAAVRELVSATPNPVTNGWNEFVVFGLALHGATGGSADGLALFAEWASDWQRGETHEQDIDKLWRTAKPVSGWSLLQKLAHNFGREDFNDARWEFDVVSDEVVTSIVETIVPATLDMQHLFSPLDVCRYMMTLNIDTVAFDVPSESWYGFYGGVWHSSERGRGLAFPYPKIQEVRDSIITLLELFPSDKDRKKQIKGLQAQPFVGHVRKMMEESGHWNFDCNELDAPLLTNHLLNTPDGTYDLIKYQMQPHNPADRITKQTVVSPKFDMTKHPLWTELLSKVVKTSEERDFLQRYMGAALGGTTANKVLLTLHGLAYAGKSTLTDTIATNIMGVSRGQYAAVVTSNIVLRRPRSDNDNSAGVAEIRDTRFAVSHEGGEGLRWNENLVKTLTGGDSISARRLYENYSSRRFLGRLIATCNMLPSSGFIDSGMRERLLVMELQRVPDAERKDVRDALEAEAPWILGWLIKGHKMNQDRPVTRSEFVPDSIKLQTAEATTEDDPIGRFVSEALILDDKEWTSAADLFAAAQTFCLARDITVSIGANTNAFSKRLKQLPKMADRYARKNSGPGYRVEIHKKVMEKIEVDATVNELLEPPE